ncbi:S8 family serine peptidase [Pararhizobium haloflavum]|uniref:S8 family serine peptidase n=1 Tax=Pararhizobium haloflavum TaxID=2037914 RepID=UPI000C187F1C|nr:S8 family serine peptidase [Pararhizobium haloflavum]
MAHGASFPINQGLWHLNNFGQFGDGLTDINVLPVWQDYRGEGIRVAVFDSGIDTTHPDLAANYLEAFDFNFVDGVEDGSYLTLEEADPHGTFVAGLIAGTGEGSGIVGVAFESTFTGYAGFNGALAATAFAKAADDGFDVMNNSWGPTLPFSNSHNTDYFQSIEYAAGTGREGLGLNIVFAAGNDYQLPHFFGDLGFEWSGEFPYADTNMDMLANSRFVISVGALDINGTYQDGEDGQGYTTPGASLLVSAPGTNVASTDIQGDLGYNLEGDVAVSSGTSFAAPVVSGVIALILQANPNLGYRDVQDILAHSARLTDLEDESWQVNAATDANGGGMATNENYGFGLVDATAAVRLAETWTEQKTLANEISTTASAQSGARAIPDGGETTFTFTLEDGIDIETLALEFDITHEEFGDLIVILTSPSGTESFLLYRIADARASELVGAVAAAEGYDGEISNTINHTLTSAHFRGEASGGEWTVRIEDAKQGDIGTVNALTLSAYGSEAGDNDTYIYTDDFGALAAIEEQRTILDDASGFNTLNFAAVSGAVSVDLAAGAADVAGTALTLTDATNISLVFSGDGNDLIALSRADQAVMAGRGSDTIEVFASASVDGGAGFDQIVLAGSRADYQFAQTSSGVSVGFDAGTVAAENVQYFAFSEESDAVMMVLDNDAQGDLARLYDQLLGRSAEFAGMVYWTETLDHGTNLATIANAITDTAEFMRWSDALSSDDFVGALYQQALGRNADDADSGYWCGQLDAGVGRDEVAARVALSVEADAMTFDHITIFGQDDMMVA